MILSSPFLRSGQFFMAPEGNAISFGGEVGFKNAPGANGFDDARLRRLFPSYNVRIFDKCGGTSAVHTRSRAISGSSSDGCSGFFQPSIGTADVKTGVSLPKAAYVIML